MVPSPGAPRRAAGAWAARPGAAGCRDVDRAASVDALQRLTEIAWTLRSDEVLPNVKHVREKFMKISGHDVANFTKWSGPGLPEVRFLVFIQRLGGVAGCAAFR